MHICNITSVPIPPEEGIGNYIYGLSTKLIEKGHKVTVITRGSWSKTQKEVIDGIDVIRAPFIPVYPFYIDIHGIYVNKVFKSLESQVDIVHIHTPLSPLITTSLPLIATVHTPMLIDTRFNEIINFRSIIGRVMGRFVSYPLELKLLKRADRITTVSNSVSQELREYGISPDETTVVGNGINEKIFTPMQNKVEKKYIFYTGRLAYRKGLFDLIESGKYICNKYPDISFVISGKGNLLQKLQKRAEKLGLQDRFKFIGYVDRDRLIQLYQNATAYVMPSHYEGLPTVLLEAMSCGLPVVATSISGNRDVISSGENGILIPPKSPKEMADAISMLLDNPEMRDELGKNARKTIEEKFTWDVISARILQCYNSLLNKIN